MVLAHHLQFFEFMNTEQLEQLEKKLKELQDNITAISGYLIELKYDIKNKKSSSS